MEFPRNLLGFPRSFLEFPRNVLEIQRQFLEIPRHFLEFPIFFWECPRIEISRIIDFDQKLNVFRPIRSTVKTIELDYNLEVSELDALFELKPNDQVYVRQEPGFIEQQNVTLAGEFNYPGTYSLFAENDRLYDLLQRAGGLSEFALQKVLSYSEVKLIWVIYLSN